MKQRYRKLLSLILTAAMALTLLPTAALASEDEAADAPVCVCEALCTEEATNADCPVCAEGYENCAYTALEDPVKSPAEGETPETPAESPAEGETPEPPAENPSEGENPEPPAESPAEGENSEDPAPCVCEALCTEDTVNTECPVCKDGYESCTYVDPEGWDALATSATLSNNTVYVDGNTQSEGTGTRESPCKTIEAAADKISAKGSGTIVLLSDITRATAYNPHGNGKKVTITSDGDNTYTIFHVVSQGVQEPDSMWHLPDNSGAEVILTNITIDGTGHTKGRWGDFFIGNGCKLTLGDGATLQNFTPQAVNIRKGGTVIMQPGSTITGCTAGTNPKYDADGYTGTANAGAAVYVCPGGTFEMQGGEISGNKGAAGAAVYGEGGAILKMSGTPVVKDNTNTTANSAANVFLGVYSNQSQVIQLTGRLIEGADVHIYVQKMPDKAGAEVQVASGAEQGEESFFTSDQPAAAGMIFKNNGLYLSYDARDQITAHAGVDSVTVDTLDGYYYTIVDSSGDVVSDLHADGGTKANGSDVWYTDDDGDGQITFTPMKTGYKVVMSANTKVTPGDKKDQGVSLSYYYVATTGASGNDGTRGNPLDTLATAYGKIQIGEVAAIIVLDNLTVDKTTEFKDGKTVTLTGDAGAAASVTLTAEAAMFTVNNAAERITVQNLTLDGGKAAGDYRAAVANAGTFTLGDGAKVQNFYMTYASGNYGILSAYGANSTVTMEGTALITENHVGNGTVTNSGAFQPNGVLTAGSGGKVVITGGEVSGNTLSGYYTTVVCLGLASNPSFTMTGGSIQNNRLLGDTGAGTDEAKQPGVAAVFMRGAASAANLSFGGSATVYDNKDDSGQQRNICIKNTSYADTDAYINIISALSGRLGIYVLEMPSAEGQKTLVAQGSGYTVTTPDSGHIRSDKSTTAGVVLDAQKVYLSYDAREKADPAVISGRTAHSITVDPKEGEAYQVGDGPFYKVEGGKLLVEQADGSWTQAPGDSGAALTPTGKITFTGLDKDTSYALSNKILATGAEGGISVKTSAVEAVDIARAFDKDAVQDESGQDNVAGDAYAVAVGIDDDGNYKATLKADITAEKTGAADGATVTIPDTWGSVTVDLGEFDIKGGDGADGQPGKPAIAFEGASGSGSSISFTGTTGKIIGGNGGANGGAGGDAVTSSNDPSDVALTFNGVDVSGGRGADATGENTPGGAGGLGVSGPFDVTVAQDSSIRGGAGGSGKGSGAGGAGGSGLNSTGEAHTVTVTGGTIAAGNGGAADPKGTGAGGNGGGGLIADGSVSIDADAPVSVTGGNAGDGGMAGAGGNGGGGITSSNGSVTTEGDKSISVTGGMGGNGGAATGDADAGKGGNGGSGITGKTNVTLGANATANAGSGGNGGDSSKGTAGTGGNGGNKGDGGTGGAGGQGGQGAAGAGSNGAGTGNPMPTAKVTITGSAKVGSTLNAVYGGAVTPVTYRWQVLKDGKWVDIADAADASYTLTEHEKGCSVRVLVSSGAYDGALISNPTDAVAAAGSSSGGGSSGGGSSSGNIQTGKADNGKIKVDKPNASKGQTVTVTVTPDPGYQLDKLTVTDKNGKELELKDLGNGKFSFVMPDAKPVKVNAAFVATGATGDPHTNGVADLLIVDDHFAYMQGNDDGRFLPTANMTRAQAAQIFYNLLKDKSVTGAADYHDVASDAWYARAVAVLTELGIVKGVGDGNFAPERNITRAEFVTMAMRFATNVTGTKTFTDVGGDHWAYDYITGAAYYGWINGYEDGSFKPSNPISRAEAVCVVNNMLARDPDESFIKNAEGLKTFPDVGKDNWAFYEITEATNAHDFTLKDGVEHWTK